MVLTLFVSSVFLALVASARPIAVDGRASSFQKPGTLRDYKRTRADSSAARVLSSVQPALARRLDGTPVRFVRSAHDPSEELLDSLELGSDAPHALVPLDGGTILDDAALNTLLDKAGAASSLSALDGFVPKTPEVLSKNATLPAESDTPIAVPLGVAPLLLSLSASVALFAIISAGLWAQTLLRRALHPEVGLEKIPFDADAKELVGERVGEKEKDLFAQAMQQTGLGLSFPREKAVSAVITEKDAFGPPADGHIVSPPSYDTTVLTPAPALVRTSALRGFTTSLLPPLEIDEPAVLALSPVLPISGLPTLTIEYDDPPTPTLPAHASNDPPTPTLPGNLTLPSVPMHAPVAVTRPEGAAVLRALLSVADVGDPAWILRVLVLMLGWALAAAAPVGEAHLRVQAPEPALVQERERRVAVLA